jgi:hypothetical protein
VRFLLLLDPFQRRDLSLDEHQVLWRHLRFQGRQALAHRLEIVPLPNHALRDRQIYNRGLDRRIDAVLVIRAAPADLAERLFTARWYNSVDP